MIRNVVHFIDSDLFGGTEQIVLHVLAGLNRRRWQPVLFHHPEAGLTPLFERAKSLDVRLRPIPRVQGRRSLVTWLPRVIKELRAEQPAVFHAHLCGPLACKDALIAAVLARIPAVIATAHLFGELPLSYFAYGQQRFLATGVDRYIAVSHEVARRLHQVFNIPVRKINVVHNGIPLPTIDAPANTALRRTLMRGTDRAIVLVTARLDKQKGHHYLLRAASLVPTAVFVLVGDGPERASLEAQARALGLSDRVTFLGYRNDVGDLLTTCDLFVLPSLFEGLPLSVLEAMAAGKPVVATAIGGTDEAIVQGHTGLLVRPGDPVALAAAIQKVLSNPKLARRLAAAGKARVHEHFSADAMVQNVTNIYEQILSSHEAPHGLH
jgi:glycosyltransferase involved in cell wall biosynthesis